MDNIRKKFILYALLSVFVLLTLLLSVISGVNFTLAAQDADEITLRLADGGGKFGTQPPQEQPQGKPGGTQRERRVGPMGPDSPELSASMRHFTCIFDQDGGHVVFFALSAITEEEALEWADSLRSHAPAGWTRFTYRYRVRELGNVTYVTVIDQGRELLPSYRILIISVIGEIVSLLLVWAVLSAVSRHLYRPLEAADRRQRLFLSEAERKFKVPLTVIHGDIELLELAHGPSDSTVSIRRQVGKLTELVRELSSLSVLWGENLRRETLDFSQLCTEALDGCAERFTGIGLNLTAEVAEGITVQGDEAALRKMVEELLENARKYCRSGAMFRLAREKERVTLTVSNDTDLPDGNVEAVFDRFIRLENALDLPDSGAGLGLAYVKDIVLGHGGRVGAKCADGTFTVSIRL